MVTGLKPQACPSHFVLFMLRLSHNTTSDCGNGESAVNPPLATPGQERFENMLIHELSGNFVIQLRVHDPDASFLSRLL
jgi:hypothetical protein